MSCHIFIFYSSAKVAFLLNILLAGFADGDAAGEGVAENLKWTSAAPIFSLARTRMGMWLASSPTHTSADSLFCSNAGSYY
jgi:hypothetical protein